MAGEDNPNGDYYYTSVWGQAYRYYDGTGRPSGDDHVGFCGKCMSPEAVSLPPTVGGENHIESKK